MKVLSEVLRAFLEDNDETFLNQKNHSEVQQVLVEEDRGTYLMRRFTKRNYRNQIYEPALVHDGDVQYPKISPGDNYFIENQFISYSLTHDDRYDKLDYCNNYINKTIADQEGLFKDFPHVKNDLLLIFKVEQDSLRKSIYGANYIKEYTLDFNDIFGQLKRNNDTIAELQRCINILLDKVNSNKRKSTNKKIALEYKDIFKNEKIAIELKNLFQTNGFTDKSGKWNGLTGAKNELAIAYYVLKDPAYGFHFIKPGDKKNQLMALYNEFGLKVTEKADQNSDTSIRNLTTEPTPGETHDEFIRIFKPLHKFTK